MGSSKGSTQAEAARLKKAAEEKGQEIEFGGCGPEVPPPFPWRRLRALMSAGR